MPVAPMLYQEKFTDADEFCAAAPGWDIQFNQLDAGPLEATIELVAAPGFVVQRVWLDRRFHQQGCSPRGVLTFGLPEPSRILNWCGRPLSGSGLLNFNRCGGYDSVSEAGFSAYTVSMTEEIFHDAASILGTDVSADMVRNAPDEFQIATVDVERILDAVKSLHAGSQLASSNAERANMELQDEIVLAIVTAIGEPAPEYNEEKFSQRQQAVNRALSYINSNVDFDTVRDVQQACGSSWRTLTRGFHERFGIAPKKYIIAARLVSARRNLIESSPDARIADIAHDSGFSHLGRFSSEYKRMFDELPSQTLLR